MNGQDDRRGFEELSPDSFPPSKKYPLNIPYFLIDRIFYTISKSQQYVIRYDTKSLLYHELLSFLRTGRIPKRCMWRFCNLFLLHMGHVLRMMDLSKLFLFLA